MFENINFKIIDIVDACKRQLEVSKTFQTKRDDFNIRIAIILIDNTMEVLFKNIHILSYITDRELTNGTVRQIDFSDLLNGLSKSKKIDRYQKFILTFMHKIRNQFYHKGFPSGLEYAMKIPDLLKRLAMIYINLASDLLIDLGKFLPKNASSNNRIYSEIKELKYDFSPANDFDLSIDAFLKFYAVKWGILNDMIEFVTRHTTVKSDPDSIFKWFEFCRKGYVFKTHKKLEEDYKQFKSKFKFTEHVNIGKKILKAFRALESEAIAKHRDKISQLLEEIDTLLCKYEKMIYTGFITADLAIDMKLDQMRGK